MTAILTKEHNFFAPFGVLEIEVRKKIESQLKIFQFQKKQIIHRAGFTPTGLFIINKGKVKIYKISDSSREIIIHIAGEGEMVGYSALMRHSEYHFWAETIEKTEMSFLPKKNFFECIENNPHFSVSLMKLFACQFDAVMDKMVDILSDQVRKRTAKTLLWLMETHGLDEDLKTIKITLSRNDLAHLVATNTETLVRTLTELSKDKVIELKRKKIVIMNLEELNRIAHFYR
ncbi:MAG TPA: Crp/Fnr family transcriptional regulator [Bacteroidia bacterium]|nr:Crp/Fnr family transcriptional regulator [Bacteroidia bacterium]